MRYPLTAGALSDFVTFSPMKYRSNSKGGPASAGAQAIMLYMPNNMPNIGNANSWGGSTFTGPIGAAMKDVQSSIVTGVLGAGNTSMSNLMQDVQKQLNPEKIISSGMDMGKQKVLQQVQKLSGRSPNQMMAVAEGKVYNPNVELIYSQPEFRRFNFSFDFVPKSAAESSMVNRIIKSFKTYSAPSDLGNGMFEVPYVWQVSYGGPAKNFMNKFKPAACMDVSITYNQATEMHVSHADGAPVQTSMSLTFMEVDIITRQDHEEGGAQGY